MTVRMERMVLRILGWRDRCLFDASKRQAEKMPVCKTGRFAFCVFPLIGCLGKASDVAEGY